MSERTCAIPDCGNPSRARGWCTKHYQRWLKNGDPLTTSVIKGDDEARLWSKVDRRGDDECWPWLGVKCRDGYGLFKVDGKMRRAHRVMHELLVGAVPDGMVLDHICHRPERCVGGNQCPHRLCVNPRHLVVATCAENNAADRLSSASRRRTHCPQGHAYTPENTYVSKAGWRKCRACNRERARLLRVP